MKNLGDWLKEIQQTHPKDWDLGLDRVGEVGRRLGVTKPADTCFLVAGTNGKGSTCEYLAQLARASHLTYGKATSPFLRTYNEQIIINGEPVVDAEIVAAFETIKAAAKEISLSYFEYGALAAMWLFKKAGVNIAILEIGLGGRLDAMNIVDPDVSIITRIALDHQDWLGETREQIGFEKAGVMRTNRPVIVLDEDPPQSLVEHAEAIGSVLKLVGRDFVFNSDALEIAARSFDLRGTHLPQASAVAAIAGFLEAGFELPDEAINEALHRARLAGRFQRLQNNPVVVLDVCHNPDAAAYLVQKLKSLDVSKWHIVAGLYSDKDHAGVFQHLAPISSAWYFSDLDVPRGAKADDLRRVLSDVCGLSSQTYDKVSDALDDAKQAVQQGEGVVVLGSFSTVAAVLADV